MTAPLTIHNAQITTAAVEIKTLTITGKQVTQAVFRQLIEKELIAVDGTLNGTPWGTVNYHPDKCAPGPGVADHLHVVWQDGSDLRRSLVRTEPVFPREFCPEEADRYYAAAVHHWLLTGETCGWSGGVFLLFTGGLKIRGSLAVDSRYTREHWVKNFDGFSFVDKATDLRIWVEVSDTMCKALLAEIAAREAKEKYEEAVNFGKAHQEDATKWHPCGCGDCLLAGLAEVTALQDASLADLAAESGPMHLEDLAAAYQDALTAEADRRQRHRDVRKALADLPQLFIAV